jgi:integrase/recombinase XerC
LQNAQHGGKRPVAPKIPSTRATSTAIVVQTPLLDVPADIIEAEIVEIGGHLSKPEMTFVDVDVVAMWLRMKRNPRTKKSYQSAIDNFFDVAIQRPATPENVMAFLGLSRGPMNHVVNEYQTRLLDEGRAANTVKLRVSAIRSLVAYAHAFEFTKVDGNLLTNSIKTESYRDTRGIDRDKVKELFKQPEKRYRKKYGKNSVPALRDVAMLALLYENALRRAELCSLDVGDFDFQNCAVWIVGKGRHDRERISLTGFGTAAIMAYLERAGHADDKGPLFRNLDHNSDHSGERLSDNGLYKIVRQYGDMIGVKGLRPHKLRHSAATHALDATGGNIREVAKLTRHKKWDTLRIYDDNRQDFQGRMSNLLSGLHR